MNDDIRSEYKALTGVDPPHRRGQVRSPEMELFLNWRAGRQAHAVRVDRRGREDAQTMANLDIVLTHVDDRSTG